MCWADFWECLDGRVWYQLLQAGVKEPPEYTKDQAEVIKERGRALARRAGWIE